MPILGILPGVYGNYWGSNLGGSIGGAAEKEGTSPSQARLPLDRRLRCGCGEGAVRQSILGTCSKYVEFSEVTSYCIRRGSRQAVSAGNVV